MEPPTTIICAEHGGPFDDNPGRPVCKTCEDWLVSFLDPEGRAAAFERALRLISEHGYDNDTPVEDVFADFDSMRAIALRALSGNGGR